MNLPPELTNTKQWVIANKAKVPFNPNTRQPASVTKPETWGSFEEALAACDTAFPHVGYVLTLEDGLTFIDLDTPQNPEQEARHARVLAAFEGTYMEISESGRGLHIIAKGTAKQSIKRDKVEIYSAQRYMICTGKSFPEGETPADIVDRQELIDILVSEGAKSFEVGDAWDYPERYTDDYIIEKLEQDDRPNELFHGHWTGVYASQSEADMALLGFITTFTDNDVQAVRIFRRSGLAQRSKAYRDGYMRMTLGRLRATQRAILAEPTIPEEPEQIIVGPIVETPKTDDFDWPPGITGELAFALHEFSPRPVPLIATVGAIGMMSAFAGGYGHHNDGLNLYQVLLAPSGTGKDALKSAPQQLILKLSERVPSIINFTGPAVLASGQGLLRSLSEEGRSCCFSVFNEFGITAQRLTHPRAQGNDLMLRQVLLDIYGSSGPYGSFDGIAYAQNVNNVPRIRSPNFVFVGESVPGVFKDALNETAITSGFVPRLIIQEYRGQRPPPNAVSDQISKMLQTNLEAMIMTTITNRQTQRWTQVQWRDDAKSRYAELDADVDDRINGTDDEVTRSLWNRVMQNVKRLSALLAVGMHPSHPEVTMVALDWAIKYVMTSVNDLLLSVQHDEIASPYIERLKSRITEFVRDYYTTKPYEKAGYKSYVKKEIHAAGLISHGYLNLRLKRSKEANAVREMTHDRNPIKTAIQSLIDEGKMISIPATSLAQVIPGYEGGTYGLVYKWVH